MIKTVCPKCKSELIYKEDKVVCINCNSIFPVISGITNFFPDMDEFYEGKFGATKTEVNFLRRRIVRIYLKVSVFSNRNKHEKYYRKLKLLDGNQIKVLDLGCGGGNPDLKLNKDCYVVGIDLSLSSLLNAREVYDEVYKASATLLPFPSNTFDCVCSFDLFGHIPVNQKDDIFKEIYRVLKPEGLSFHYIEVDSPKGYNNWAKRYPKLYKKYFIERDGHFGLEYYKNTLDRFKKHGFSLLEYRVLGKFIIAPGELSKRFNNEYKAKHVGIKIAATFDASLSHNVQTKAIWGMILKPFQIVFEPLIPDCYGGMLFVAHKKK